MTVSKSAIPNCQITRTFSQNPEEGEFIYQVSSLWFCEVTQWELELLELSSIQEPGDPKSFSCQSNYKVKHRFVLSTCQPWIRLNFTFWGATAFLESIRQLCYHLQPEAANYFCSSPLVPGAGSDTTPTRCNRQSNLCRIKIPTPAHKRLRT